MPDDEIFKETTTFNYETLKTRTRELAFLNKGLRIILMDVLQQVYLYHHL